MENIHGKYPIVYWLNLMAAERFLQSLPVYSKVRPNLIRSILVGPGLLDSDNISISIVSTELASLAEPVVFDSGDEGSMVVVGPVNVIPRGVGVDTGSPDNSVDLVVHVSQGEVG